MFVLTLVVNICWLAALLTVQQNCLSYSDNYASVTAPAQLALFMRSDKVYRCINVRSRMTSKFSNHRYMDETDILGATTVATTCAFTMRHLMSGRARKTHMHEFYLVSRWPVKHQSFSCAISVFWCAQKIYFRFFNIVYCLFILVSCFQAKSCQLDTGYRVIECGTRKS